MDGKVNMGASQDTFVSLNSMAKLCWTGLGKEGFSFSASRKMFSSGCKTLAESRKFFGFSSWWWGLARTCQTRGGSKVTFLDHLWRLLETVVSGGLFLAQHLFIRRSSWAQPNWKVQMLKTYLYIYSYIYDVLGGFMTSIFCFDKDQPGSQSSFMH